MAVIVVTRTIHDPDDIDGTVGVHVFVDCNCIGDGKLGQQ